MLERFKIVFTVYSKRQIQVDSFSDQRIFRLKNSPKRGCWRESVWPPASCDADTTIKRVNKDEIGKRKIFLYPCTLSIKGTVSRLCARASVICFFFSSKDNRTVIFTRQDSLPDRTADGNVLFTFSSNIFDFRRSFSSYLKFGSRHEDSSRFCRQQGRLATRKSRSAPFKNTFSNVKLVSEVN